MTPKLHGVVATRVCMAFIHPGDTAGCFTESVAQTLIVDNGRHIQAVLGMETSPRIAAARCEIVKLFLELKERPDWLWFVDADMAWTPDMAVRFLDAAHKDRTPVLGGLCFAGGRSFGENALPKMWPTLYELFDVGQGNPGVRPIADYPRDEIVEVGATGAAFLLIHRTVLEKMARKFARMPDGHVNPYPWFAEVVNGGAQYGEDVTFCLRAAACGFPVKVHTGVKVKHRKYLYLDESHYDAVRAEAKKNRAPLTLPKAS